MSSQRFRDNLSVGSAIVVEELTAERVEAAHRHVLRHALDAADARDLLDKLGIEALS